MVKFTEYNKSFRNRPETAQLYQKGLDYRVGRRMIEHCHSADPFIWDTESETDSENMELEGRPPSVPLHKYLHEKFNRSYKEKLQKSQEINMQLLSNIAKKSSKVKQMPSKEDLHIEIPSPVENGNSSEKNIRKGKKKTKKVVSDTGYQSDDEGSSAGEQVLTPRKSGIEVADKAVQINGHSQPKKASRPKKPVTGVVSKKFIPKPRPVSAVVCRPLKAEAKDDKPPFVTYGCMDNERTTSAKKTYNVKASEEIYPSALRAMKRRELDIAKKQEKEQNAPDNEKRKRALFNDFDIKMNRETSQWDTEYRNHYVGYDQSEYKKSVPTRNPSMAAAREAFFANM